MKFLLDLIYVVLLGLLAPWLVWSAIRKGKYRQGWAAKFFGRVAPLPPATGQRVWFHAVSVGEVNLLGTILQQFLADMPDAEVVVTTTTKTGYALAKKKFSRHTVSYCPLDFSWAVRRALHTWQPDLLVLVELELWPNLLLAAREAGVPVAIVNARLSDRSLQGYLRLRRCFPRFTARVLESIQLIAAQSRACAERFEKLGIPPSRIFHTGSVKFDGAQTDRDNPLTQELRQLANIQPQQKVFLAGSTQTPEESYALSVFEALTETHPELRLILVPRHPERADEVAQLLQKSGLPWCRRSQISLENPMTDPGILLVDTVGELGGWWGCADVGFVGGSMGSRGGQNMLEPSGYGVATCFGPNTRNFRDVVEQLCRADAAVVVQNAEEMRQHVQRCLQDDAYRRGLGRRAQDVVESQRGATKATIQLLTELLQPPHATQVSSGRKRSA